MTDIAWTRLLIYTTYAVIVAWDVYVAVFNEIPNHKDTVSGQMKYLGLARMWTLPMSWGVLGTHFWVPSTPVFGQPASAIVLVWLGWMVLWVGRRYAWQLTSTKRAALVGMFLLLFGMAAGYLLWPQPNWLAPQ